jgi:hypothetical protein
LAQFIVDSVLVTLLGAGLWLLARYAGPAIAAAGEAPLWQFLRPIHPALFALVPLAAGLGTGSLRAVPARRRFYRYAAVPLGVAVGAVAVATGAAVYATIMRMAPDAAFIFLAAMSVLAAFAVGIASVCMFLLGDSIVDSARKAVQESTDSADKRTLRKYDAAAARLATQLERTERAFRQLLTQADDARHPLTSLLNGAADTLANDRPRRLGSKAVRAALALAAAIVITGAWTAATTLAVVTAFTLLPEAVTLSHLATAAATAAATFGLCSLGSFLPPALLERHRTNAIATGLAAAVAIVTLVGMLTMGPGTGWVAAGGAIAALALSFRLPESIRATTTAAVIVACGALAVVLWPVALASAALRGGAADRS